MPAGQHEQVERLLLGDVGPLPLLAACAAQSSSVFHERLRDLIDAALLEQADSGEYDLAGFGRELGP